MKYQRPSDKGRVKCCRVCTFKRADRLREDWLFDFEVGKFQKTYFKNRWDIIKYIMR